MFATIKLTNKRIPNNYYRRLCQNVSSIPSTPPSEPPKPPTRIFSGIQPTGQMHLGNYFGAIKRWITFQDEFNPKKDPQRQSSCIYSIVDLHSITLPQESCVLQANIKLMLATLLACGLDPERCILFQQSQVPQHTQLAWIFSCLISISRLQRMAQFKEKSANIKDVPLGLLAYPVLQAADILLYKSDGVPVGDDNTQNIQLSHSLSRAFNSKYGEIFPYPQAIVDRNNFTSRLRSLRHPDKKMSKSELDQRGRINLTDSPDDILDKLKRAVTDFTSQVTFEPEVRLGVSNLVMIHSLFTGKTTQEIVSEMSGVETGRYKLLLADVVIQSLAPIREETFRLMKDELYLNQVLKNGREKASEIACETMRVVSNAIGMDIKNNLDQIKMINNQINK